MSLDTTHRFQDEKRCWFCGTTQNLHLHHIYFGANRRISDKNGFVVYLCLDHHTGPRGVHHNIDLDLELKVECEKWYLAQGHTEDDFRTLIGKNYIGKTKKSNFKTWDE